MITISFTGHRPDKLGGYDVNSARNIEIKYKIGDCINEILSRHSDDNYFRFISGGALGVDTIAFNIVNELQQVTLFNKYKDIIKFENILAVPFKNQDCKWPNKSKQEYKQMLSKADKIIYVDTIEAYKIQGYEEGIYYPAKMQKRNIYMVDNSDYLIAVWNGTKGGTKNCIDYANSIKKQIYYINI